MEALLIIDMQNDCFAVPRFDRPGTCQRINAVARRFRALQKPVIFIQHDGTKEDYLFPGSPGFQILEELEKAESDHFVTKTANSAFYKTPLHELLLRLDVDTVYLTGMATDFCVNATLHAALVHDLNVVVVQDGHTTADRPGQSAEALIAFHNWLWANLPPTDGKVTVKPLAVLIEPQGAGQPLS